MGDDLVLVLVEAVHARAVDVLHVVSGRLVKDAHQVAAHDLVLGRQALPAPAGGVGHEGRPRPAAGVEEGDTRLVDEPAADGVEQPHAPDGLDALAPEIDLGAGGPQIRVPLPHRHPVPPSGQPVRQGVSGDPTAGHENPQGGRP